MPETNKSIWAHTCPEPSEGEPWGLLRGLKTVAGPDGPAFTPEDARRLAACWNACAGLDLAEIDGLNVQRLLGSREATKEAAG